MSETKYIHCERMEKRISRAVCAILWRQANTGAGTDKMVAPNVCRGCEQGKKIAGEPVADKPVCHRSET